jgi:hypothetical protein
LKQARHRASRLFLKEGARSSLPQYLQTNFSALDAARDDRHGRRAAFLVFEARAAFGLAATVFFFAGAACPYQKLRKLRKPSDLPLSLLKT